MTNYFFDARTATPHFPGIGRYVSNLVKAIAPELRADESLSILYDAGRGKGIFTSPPEKVLPLKSAVSPFSISQQWQVPRIIRQTGARLYHSPYYLMPYRPGIPAILTVYDLIPLKFPSFFSTHARLLYRWATWLALRSASHVISISETTRQDFIELFHLNPDSISTIPLASDAQFRPQPAGEIERVLEKYGLREYILYFGINKPHKNLERLVEAWSLLRQKSPTSDRQLVIAGAWDPRYPQPKQLAARLNLDSSVTFLGPIPDEDLPALYSGAALFVFPSLYEGFGLPVLEAMACGTPVACSRGGAIQEAGGEAALTFDPLDPHAIAAAIELLLDDPRLRQDLKDRGLAQAEHFSWRETASETLKIYRGFSGIPSG